MIFHVAPNIPFPEDYIGIIPQMLHDDRPVREQLNEGYAHGGGWQPFDGFTMDEAGRLCFPGDPPQSPRVWTDYGSERIIFYDHAWVAILQRDGSFEVARMD